MPPKTIPQPVWCFSLVVGDSKLNPQPTQWYVVFRCWVGVTHILEDNPKSLGIVHNPTLIHILGRSLSAIGDTTHF